MGHADCIFCKIAVGELPASIVDEDEFTIAFMDINPATRGHTLVIPRAHATDLLEDRASPAGGGERRGSAAGRARQGAPWR